MTTDPWAWVGPPATAVAAEPAPKAVRPCKRCGGLKRTADGRCQACRATNNKKWCAANSERRKAQDRARRKANPEKERERQRAWKKANPEKDREYRDKQKTAHPYRKADYARKYRNKKRADRNIWNVLTTVDRLKQELNR